MKKILSISAAAMLFCVEVAGAEIRSGDALLARNSDTPYYHLWAWSRTAHPLHSGNFQNRIVPSPVLGLEDTSFVGTGDGSAGYWGHP